MSPGHILENSLNSKNHNNMYGGFFCFFEKKKKPSKSMNALAKTHLGTKMFVSARFLS